MATLRKTGPEYCRLKFGIDGNFKAGEQSQYVLNNWTQQEQQMLESYVFR